MKAAILSILIFTSLAHAGVTLECVEFTPHAGKYEKSLLQASKELSSIEVNENIENVYFEIANSAKIDDCFIALKEDHTRMKLDEKKSNEFCVYDNGGISEATYGWVCERMEVTLSKEENDSSGRGESIKDLDERMIRKEREALRASRQ